MAYPSKALEPYLLKSQLITLVGAPGSTGPTGAQGDPGPTGLTGAPWAPVESLTAPAIVSGGTILTANLTVSRVDPITAVDNVVLEVGTIAGQRIIVLNQSAFTIQFAVAGTSNVSNGSISVCPPLTCIRLLWNSVNNLWYPAPGATSAAPGTAQYDITAYDTSTYQ